VENEYNSYNFRLFAIFVPKIISWWKFDEVMTKIILLGFRDTVYIANVFSFISFLFTVYYTKQYVNIPLQITNNTESCM